MIAVIGILAAIAIPAYQDYTMRVEVTKALPWVDRVIQSAGTYVAQNEAYPESMDEIGLPSALPQGPVSAIALTGEGFELTLRSAHAKVNGQTILVAAHRAKDGSIEWQCTGGTMDQKYRPPRCRAAR